MNGTFEHEEEVLFTDPTSKGGNVLAVIDSDLDTSSADSNCEHRKNYGNRDGYKKCCTKCLILLSIRTTTLDPSSVSDGLDHIRGELINGQTQSIQNMV